MLLFNGTGSLLKTTPGFWSYGLNIKVETSEDRNLSTQKCCGQEDTSLSQKGQVQQHPTPRAEMTEP